ncbi:hypothetical protein BGZ65_003421 [Modicella reniformis]|uniref:Stress-activated map kinase-interacting protein 1 n=1 Tax=Modicella reniformis TaxID=1440133 RepID=A0A9P6IL21_9FUNG|nr:hypothetical protein BGZ65_003421 [Modicella reniformis]
MSLLSDPGYIVHNLRLSNLRLKDRTADKIITFPLQLLSNEYVKAAGPVSPDAQHCYSPNISHDYLMLGNSSLLLGSNDLASNQADNTPTSSQPTKPVFGARVKSDRRRVVPAQAAAAAAAMAMAGLGRGGNEGGTSNTPSTQATPIPATRSAIPMAVASMESDDDIDLDDEDPVRKSPPRMSHKMAIPAHVGGDFAPGIFITTPSRPGSATIPEDAHQNASQKPITGVSTGTSSYRNMTQSISRDPEIDMTLDSMTSHLDLSPPESAAARHLEKDHISAVNPFISSIPSNGDIFQHTRGVGLPSMDAILSNPVPVKKPPPVSLLTSLLNQQKTRDENPFAEEFLKIAGMGEPNPVQLKIYLPASEKPKDPLLVVVKREGTIEDVIGYILYQYYHEGRTPLLSEEQSTVVQWNLRIVEDDGEIDDDLPAVERTLKIGKFSTSQRFAMNQFALCEATPAQAKINENLYAKSGKPVVRPKKQAPGTSPTGLGPPDPSKAPTLGPHGEFKPNQLSEKVSAEFSANDAMVNANASTLVGGTGTTLRSDPLVAGTQHYVRVCLHTNHEVKHTTTVEILPKMLVSGVINYICNKRKMDPSDWMLVVEDTRTKLPLDGAAEDIASTTELSLVHKSKEVFRDYILNRKRRGGYVGHHEQVLAIDGDYIRIMPSSNKTLLFDSGKTNSYFKNMIYDCRQGKKAPHHFKLVVLRGDRSERKIYEFEAKSQQQAHRDTN